MASGRKGWEEIERDGERGKEVQRRQIREESRERHRQKGVKIKKEKDRDGRGKQRREKKKAERVLEIALHYNTLLLQLCHLHSNNGGSASVEHLLINNRTEDGERGRGIWEVGVEVLSRSRPPYGLNDISCYLTLSALLPPQRSHLCPCLYRYKTERHLFIFLPLGSNLDSQSSRGQQQKPQYKGSSGLLNESHIDIAGSNSYS